MRLWWTVTLLNEEVTCDLRISYEDEIVVDSNTAQWGSDVRPQNKRRLQDQIGLWKGHKALGSRDKKYFSHSWQSWRQVRLAWQAAIELWTATTSQVWHRRQQIRQDHVHISWAQRTYARLTKAVCIREYKDGYLVTSIGNMVIDRTSDCAMMV